MSEIMRVDDPYIDKLMKALFGTEFRKGSVPAAGYTEGIDLLIEAFCTHKADGSNVYFIGNGGSAAVAGHMSADYLKNGGFSVVSLYSFPTLTCLGNDFCYDDIFSKQLEMNAKAGELLVTISSSGESENIYRAVMVAKEKGMDVITLTGFESNNRTRALGDVNVYVPSKEYGIVESIHNLILQQVVDEIMENNEKPRDLS